MAENQTEQGEFKVKLTMLMNSREKLVLWPDIQHLFKDNELVCSQETWFTNQNLKVINNLHESFHGLAC